MPQPASTPSPKPVGRPAPAKSPAPSLAERRSFMARAWAVVIGGIVLLVPSAAGLAVWLDPLRRRGGRETFIPVATLDAVPDDGVPREFPVIAERADAWNRSREPIGAVYLRRTGSDKPIECLTATCPHAGCFVDYDAEAGTFKCPCHNSCFEPDGAIIEPSPSPRPMDTLECKVEGDEVLVRFQSFYSGKPEKVAKG